MRHLIISAKLVLIFIVLLPIQANADIVVILNPSSGINELTRLQVVDIYMGRKVTMPNGKLFVPYGHPKNSTIRANFYKKLIGKSAASVNAYWARLIFTGRASPPKMVSDGIKMREIIENNPNTVGYININDLNDRVNVVFRFDPDE
jgi:ABC-type phosphate transport system substrate-binding protein